MDPHQRGQHGQRAHEPGRPGQRHLDRLPDGRRRGARRRDEPDDQRHVDAQERPGRSTPRTTRGSSARPAASAARTRCPSTGHRIRAAAVAARAELLKLASAKLGVPVASLTVDKGVVSGGGKTVTYGELVGGKLFSVNLTTTSLQHGVGAGEAGEPVQARRHDGAACGHPGQGVGQVHLHARHHRPGHAARPLGPPGSGPVADRRLREAAVGRRELDQAPAERQGRSSRATSSPSSARSSTRSCRPPTQLKVKWAESPILPGHANLWASFRKADSAGKMPARITGTAGNFDTAFKSAAKTVVGARSCTRTTATTRSARPAPSPTTRPSAVPTRTRSRCSQHAEQLEHDRRRPGGARPRQARTRCG